jgi:dienelactone hydrolase
MGIASRSLPGLLVIVLLWPAGRARGDVREGVERYRSGEASVAMEWFAPADRGRYPAVVLLHGSGGLEPGTAAVFRAVARDFAERGYAAMIPHYFERTGHSTGEPFRPGEIPSFVEAVADGIEFGVASGIVDPDRIGIIGYSMGAYIAFFRGARDPRIKAVVSVAGSLPVESRSKFPPVLILQGSNDRSNPVSRIKAFQEVLKAQGTPSASHVYRGMGHNFDVERWEDAAFRASAFFDRHMRRNATSTRSRRAQRGRKDPGRAGAARAGVAEEEAQKGDSPASPDRPPIPPEGDGPADPPKPRESPDRPAAGSRSSAAFSTGISEDEVSAFRTSRGGSSHDNPASACAAGCR